MWRTEKFIVANGFTQFNNPKVANDLSPYEYFDGDLGQSIDMEFADANGKSKRKPKKRETTFEKIMAYTPMGMAKRGFDVLTDEDRIAKRRQRKDAITNKELETQKSILEQSSKSDENIIKSLTNQELPPVSSDKKSSNKIYWIIGGVAVAGIIGYVLYKKLKK